MFVIKRHDRRPRYRVKLTQSDPSTGIQVPVDLSGASSVRFIMTGKSGVVVVNSAADFVDPVNGIVEYAWADGDTATAGDFNVEFEVMWGDEPQTFPSYGYFTCKIVNDLA
jgi:hypothetical protein